MLFTSPIMLGENTPPIGIIGVILILIGLGIFDKNFFQMDKNFFIVLKKPGALAMLAAAILFFVLSALLSIYLIYRGGIPILLIAISSIICGFFYTAGRKSLGYLGLGELFVLIFCI